MAVLIVSCQRLAIMLLWPEWYALQRLSRANSDKSEKVTYSGGVLERHCTTWRNPEVSASGGLKLHGPVCLFVF